MSNSRSNYPSNDIPRRVCFVFIKTLKDKRVCTKAHFGEVTIIITYLSSWPSLPNYASTYAIATPIFYIFYEDMGIYVKFMICGNSEIIRLKNLWRDT